MSNVGKFFPFLAWMSDYKRGYLIRDLIAGLIISVVLIPQSMSYAMIAGLPPIYGLYAAGIPPIIAALWGRSRQLATGPVAIVSLLTFSSIIPFAKPGTPEFISMAINLATLAGLFQLLMGVLKLGFVMRFVSHPVIVGFTNAGALIIATTQVKHLLGIDIKESEFIFPMFIEIMKSITDINMYTFTTGLFALGIIAGGRYIHKDFPGAMVASVITTLGVYLFNIKELGVKTIGDMPGGLPSISVPFTEYIEVVGSQTAWGLPSVSWTFVNIEIIFRLVGPAIIIAIVGFMEALAITKSISARTKEPVDVNQELVGQGTANIIGSFFRSYPVSGSFSRSAVNLQAGGRSGFSNVFSGLIVIFTLMFFTSTFYYLPKATLAAIVMSAVVGLVKHSQFIKLYKTNKQDGIVASITFLFAFLIKPDYAIFIGIALSLLIFLWESMSPRIVILTRDPKSEIFVNAESKRLPVCPQILYIMPDFPIYFANAEFVREGILEEARVRKNGLKYILMDMEMVNKIDATGVDELKELVYELRKSGIELYIANVKALVREVLESSGFMDVLEQETWLVSKSDSIIRLFNKIDYRYCKEECPYVVFWECETVK